MKKVVCFFVALFLLMLTACAGQNQPLEPTYPSTEPVTPPAEEPSAPADDPEEPDEPDEPDLFWLPPKTEKLSFQEYFATDRPYYHSSFWLVGSGDTLQGYTLKLSEVGLQVCAYDTNPWDEEESVTFHTVPNSESLFGQELIGTDGTIACFLERNDVMAGIFLVDLVSGVRTSIVENTIITDVKFFNDVIIYTAFIGYEMQIVCHYIPTAEALLIPTGQTVPALFTLYEPTSTQGTLTWVGITDDMAQRLTAALEDPDSKYKKHPDHAGIDLSFLWEDNKTLVSGDSRALHWVCYFIQQENGTQSLLKCQHDMTTAQSTQVTGIIDNCWFGSGYSHDHFAPDAPAPDEPVSSIGAWQPFAEAMKATESETLNPHIESYQGYVYQVTDSEFMRLIDMPLRFCTISASQDAYYAITKDNTLIRIYTDGTEPTVLYQGCNDLDWGSTKASKIYLRDGDTIVELDLQTQQWRTVFTHEDMSWFYVDSENVLYVVLSRGLHVASYLYDLTSGEFVSVGYRL